MPKVTQGERRQHERVPVELQATLTRVGGRGYSQDVRTVDLSEGGAGIVAPDGFNVGDVVILTVGSVDVEIGYQGLVVGRREDAPTEDGQVLNIAFKTMRDEMLRSLQALLARHGAPQQG